MISMPWLVLRSEGLAIGTVIAHRPPHGPVLAQLRHTVLTLSMAVRERSAKDLALRLSARAQAPVTRVSSSVSGTCFARPRSSWSPPLVPSRQWRAMSTTSAAAAPALFVGFVAPMAELDFSRSSFILGSSLILGSSPRTYGSSPCPCRTRAVTQYRWSAVRSPSSRSRSFRTCQVLRPRRAVRALANSAPVRVAFRPFDRESTRIYPLSRLFCLTYALPCQRFAEALAGTSRLTWASMWIATPSS